MRVVLDGFSPPTGGEPLVPPIALRDFGVLGERSEVEDGAEMVLVIGELLDLPTKDGRECKGGG